MCDPVVIPLAASTAIGVGTSISRAQQEKQAARANIKLAEASRSRALQEGVTKASQVGASMRQAQSTALTIAGGSGTDTTAGTAGSLIDRSAVAGAADIEQARANAAMQAFGFEVESSNLNRRLQAIGDEEVFGIAGSVLGGIGKSSTALT